MALYWGSVPATLIQVRFPKFSLGSIALTYVSACNFARVVFVCGPVESFDFSFDQFELPNSLYALIL